MKFNIREVFCEILSGLVLLILIIPSLELFDIYTINEFLLEISKNLNVSNVTLTIIISYLVGLIVDSIGYSIGECFLDDWINKEEMPEDKKKRFYNYVSAHVLSYRDTQWAYYSLYRNLLILFLFHGVLWSICLFINQQPCIGILLLLLIGLIEISFFRTSRGLSKLYTEITLYIERGHTT